MKLKHLYLALCILGTLLPYSRFPGFDLHVLTGQLFAFFGMDVIVSSVVLWVFVFADGRRIGVRHLWVPIAANLLVGVSLGLPLYLYMREARFEKT